MSQATVVVQGMICCSHRLFWSLEIVTFQARQLLAGTEPGA